MQNNQQPPPGTLSGQLSIQDLMSIYAFLANLTNPSEKIIKAKDVMEDFIVAFSQSLGTVPNEQARR